MDVAPRLIAIAMLLSACAAEQKALDETLPPLGARPVFLQETGAAIAKNGTLSQLLRGQKIADADAWIAALAKATDLKKLRAGDGVRFVRSLDQTLQKIVLEKNAWEHAVVSRAGANFTAAMQRDPTTVTTELVEIEVESSLYQALVGAGWDPAIAFDLADVFAWDLDFYSDVQKGDRVLALVDVRRRESTGGPGEFIGYGALHGAVYDGQVGRFSAYHYNDGFYDETGHSLRKEFLKSPLKYAHVTSKFGSRKHPVLGYTRQHQGVDFQASVGTPVWAVGDGKVTFAGWQGGYGKFVTVRHPNGYETAYAHLSAINVRVGQHIAQKAVVGMSGNTGLSSGPHLHFGLKLGGTFINPFSLKPVRVEPLAQEEMPRFKQAIDGVQKRLDEARQRRS